MKENLKEIKPKEGIGSIRFGMKREDVRKNLGDPDEIDGYSFSGDGDDRSESWHYDELALSMAFDEVEDWRLTTISVSSNFYELYGKSLIGISRSDLEDQLDEMGISEWDVEDWSTSDEDGDQKLISAEKLFVNFWMEGEILTEIQWSPAFDEDDVIQWP